MVNFCEKTKKSPIDNVMKNCSTNLSRDVLIRVRLSVVKGAVGSSVDESRFIVRISDRVCGSMLLFVILPKYALALLANNARNSPVDGGSFQCFASLESGIPSD